MFEFAVNNKPDWLTLNTITGEIYGTPNSEDIGLYRNISYTVSNSDQEITSNEFYINVRNTNDPPTAYSIPNETVPTPTLYEGETVVIDLIATDPDEDSLRYYIGQKPVNGDASIAGNQLTYRHKGTNTTTDSLTYYAKDSGLSSDAVSININIIPVNDYPELNDLTNSLFQTVR